MDFFLGIAARTLTFATPGKQLLLYVHPDMLDRVMGRQIILIHWNARSKESNFDVNHDSSHDDLVAFADIVIATRVDKSERAARSPGQSMIFGAKHACSPELIMLGIGICP